MGTSITSQRTFASKSFEFDTVVNRYRTRWRDEILRPLGLSRRDGFMLEFLLNRKGRATLNEIATTLESLNMWPAKTSTISQAITALWRREKGSLVQKEFNPEDQRQPIIVLTSEGKKIAEKTSRVNLLVMRLYREAMDLTVTDEKVLLRVFERGRDNFEKLAKEAAPKKP